MSLSKKEKQQLLAVGLLLVVFTVALIWRIKGAKAVKPAVSKNLFFENADVYNFSQEDSLFLKFDKKSEEIDFKRDPFYGTQISTVDLGEFQSGAFMLTGIFWDDKVPCAIINGKVVRVGDSLGDKKIKEILKDKVIFNDGMKDVELKLAR